MERSTSPLAYLLESLREKYVRRIDQEYLNFIFTEKPTQQALDDCLERCDIETLGAGKCILLSYLMAAHPELSLSSYAGPRINGLITYYRFANTKTLSHFSRIGKAYNAAKIPMLLFKGGAMKVLRPNLPRPMGDADVLVPAERIGEATKIGEDLGYEHVKEESKHAVDFHTATESAVDVHHSLFDTQRDLKPLYEKMWSRAKLEKAFGVEFYLPCREDLCFLVMTNFTKNLREHTSLSGLYFALEDTRFLQQGENFDWNIVRENASLAGRELEVAFAAEFMNNIIPGIIPDYRRIFPFVQKMNDFCRQVIFDEKFFLPRQKQCQAIRVVELKNNPVKLGKFIGKFLLMKKLRPFPAFVSWFLRRKGFEV